MSDYRFSKLHFSSSLPSATSKHNSVSASYQEVPFEDNSQTPGVVFKVAEVSKERFRVVHDPFVLNVMLPDPPKFAFQPLKAARRMCTCKFSAQFDFKKYYYQFPLSEAVTKVYHFNVENHTFAMLRLPMGIKWARAIAQQTTCKLVQLAIENSQVDAKNLWVDVYIDNVKFVSDCKSHIDAVYFAFINVCSKFNVTIGEANPIR